MKKTVAVVVIAAVLFTVGTYLFIPSKIVVSNVRTLHAYQNSVIRFFDDSAMLNSWWRQAAKAEGANNYSYNGTIYRVEGSLSNLVKITIQPGNKNLQSALVSLNIYMDSSAIQWTTEITASLNPFERIKQYNGAKDLKDNMAGLMNKLQQHLNQSANIYGIDVKAVKVTDSLLISTKIILAGYPTVSETYTLVKKLKGYAAGQQAGQTDSPMQNVTRLEDGRYQVMVGLPINRMVKETADIRIKRMPYMKDMFITTITGGTYSIQKALDKMREYSLDSRRASPAIPFELMVTDRQNQPDTTKWVTTIYYPII